jgi:hypothetical protein
MFAKAFAAAAILLAAAPSAFAAGKAASADDHAGPIPYSELAAADAKLNPPAAKRAVRHHRKRTVKAKADTAAAATTAPAPAAAK